MQCSTMQNGSFTVRHNRQSRERTSLYEMACDQSIRKVKPPGILDGSTILFKLNLKFTSSYYTVAVNHGGTLTPRREFRQMRRQ